MAAVPAGSAQGLSCGEHFGNMSAVCVHAAGSIINEEVYNSDTKRMLRTSVARGQWLQVAVVPGLKFVKNVI